MAQFQYHSTSVLVHWYEAGCKGIETPPPLKGILAISYQNHQPYYLSAMVPSYRANLHLSIGALPCCRRYKQLGIDYRCHPYELLQHDFLAAISSV